MWFLIVTLFPNIGPLGVLAGHSFSIVLYFFLFLKFKVKFPAYFKYLILGSLFFSSTIVLSQLANYDQLGFSLGQLKYSIIPFYWIFGLLAGIVDAKIFGLKKTDSLFSFAAVFILAQIPLILLQIMGFDSLLWISEKARDWTGILRVVGTVQNPNTLGILTVLCIVVFAHFSKQKPLWSKVLIGLGALIILATGSRTSLIILLFLPLLFVSKEALFSKKIVYTLLAVCLGLVLFYFVLLFLKDRLPYMSQNLSLVEGQSVHTLSLRFSIWENVGEIYQSASIKNRLFGFGPGYFSVMDNSYFYVLFNYGVIGSVFFLFSLFILLVNLKVNNIEIARRSLYVLLICGLVADVL